MADGASPIPLIQPGGVSLVSATLANQLIVPLNAIIHAKVAPVAGIGSFKYAGGEYILDFAALDKRLRELESGAGGGSVILPFHLSDVSPDISTPTINVLYGTVMDIAPSAIGTDIALTDDATNTVYLDCTLDASGVVTAVDLLVNTTGKPADASDHAYLLVGTAVVASGVITLDQSLMFSQGFSSCGRDPADPSTTPGTYEFFVR
jgi:hypothetical protein